MARRETGEVLLRAMAAVAAADGSVGDRELETILEIYADVTGEEASLEELREIVEAGWEGGADPAGFVSSLGAGAPLDAKLRIARACYRVLSADGEITGPEAHTFNAVVRGLDLSRKDVLERL